MYHLIIQLSAIYQIYQMKMKQLTFVFIVKVLIYAILGACLGKAFIVLKSVQTNAGHFYVC